MNNYSLSNVSSNNYYYTNNNTISYNDDSKKDNYIIWNSSNLPYTQTSLLYSSYFANASSWYKTSDNNYYENFYIYKWNYSYEYYNAFFKSDITDKQTTKLYTTFKNVNYYSSYIGNLCKENNSIYFESMPHTNQTYTNLLIPYIQKDDANRTIINTYIENSNDKITNLNLAIPVITNSGSVISSNTKILTYSKGPNVIVDNGYGRPPIISKEQIDNNIISVPVVCDTVYPAYLASIEDFNKYGSDNAIRCSYAKLCGYSWSDMGCN